MIMNTNRDNKKGMYWWSFLELHTCRNIFLFDSFGFTVFKAFIIDNDHKIIHKFVYRLKKINKKENKIILGSLAFSAEAYENLSWLRSKLTTTALDLFYVLMNLQKHTI